MPVRKRKVNYPVTKTATRRAPAPGSDASTVRPNLATINTSAGAGHPGLAIGDEVRIEAAGLYAGETAVVESLVGGPIPAAVVRTEAGRTRRVRTIDLVAAPARDERGPSSP